jgi:hypothetical protein
MKNGLQQCKIIRNDFCNRKSGKIERHIKIQFQQYKIRKTDLSGHKTLQNTHGNEISMKKEY